MRTSYPAGSVARLTILLSLSLLCLAPAPAAVEVRVPLPPANLLLTADELEDLKIEGAKVFPLSRNDAKWPARTRHLLPAKAVIKPSEHGDATGQRTEPFDPLRRKLSYRTGCPEPCSQRGRDLFIIEHAAPPNENQTLFRGDLLMVLTRYAEPAHAAAALADRRQFDRAGKVEGTTLAIGDQAYLRKAGAPSFAGSKEVWLEVQQGPMHLIVACDYVGHESDYYVPKLRLLAVRVAQVIIARVKPFLASSTTTPPPTTGRGRLEITAGPGGAPNPVAPGGKVRCSVQVRHSRGLTPRYQWTAPVGSFDNGQAQNPVWTAPATGAAECLISVGITAKDGAITGASYLQKIKGAPSSSLPPPVTSTASPALRVFIDGRLMPTAAPPVEISGHVLVAVADIFRELGANVLWDGAQRRITATRGARVVQLWIGRMTAMVDDLPVALEVAPQVLGQGTTYVPVRFVSQAMGAGVTYDARNRAVMITTTGLPPLTGSATPPPPTETKLTITSPVSGATVPEQFTINGAGPPGASLSVTVIAEGMLKATGQNAKSRVLEKAPVQVGGDGRWNIAVNARGQCRDERVDLQRFRITVERQENGAAVETVELVVVP
ncbi:MAG: copper amine oxidase N-terminal domain-containing protein [Armatimonadetes bacterium]|nr:copper amine oxidase N-terminal domain-containing protein [Armatimonadota bacterium]